MNGKPKAFVLSLFLYTCLKPLYAQWEASLHPLQNQWSALAPAYLPEGYTAGMRLASSLFLPGTARGVTNVGVGTKSWSIGFELTLEGDAIYSQQQYVLGSGLLTDWGKWGVALAYSHLRFEGRPHYPELTSHITWSQEAMGYRLAAAAQWSPAAASPSRVSFGITTVNEGIVPCLFFRYQTHVPNWDLILGARYEKRPLGGSLYWRAQSRALQLQLFWSSDPWIFSVGITYSVFAQWSHDWGGGWHGNL